MMHHPFPLAAGDTTIDPMASWLPMGVSMAPGFGIDRARTGSSGLVENPDLR